MILSTKQLALATALLSASAQALAVGPVDMCSGTSTVFTTVYVTETSPAYSTATGVAGASGSYNAGSAAGSSGAGGSIAGSRISGLGGNVVGPGMSADGSASYQNGPAIAFAVDNGGSATTSTIFVPGPTLIPAVHWDHPVDDISNLAPSTNAKLYYATNGAADPSVAHSFASLNATLQYDTVILDHSSLVQSTTCSAQGVTVTFSTTEAFQYASNAWTGLSKFVLATYVNGCGASQDQRTFWLVSSISVRANSTSIVATAHQELAIGDAIFGVDMIWGHYAPDNATAGATVVGGNIGNTNSTSGTFNTNGTSSNTATCGKAPAPTIDGFPAFDCGDLDFDQKVDAAIGYYDFDSSDYLTELAQFEPGVPLNDTAPTFGKRSFSKRMLMKRCSWYDVPCFAREAAARAAELAARVKQAAIDLANKAKAEALALAAQLTEINPTITGSADINVGPNANADSPFGKAAQIFAVEKSKDGAAANAALYCVNCGIKGHFQLNGAARWNLRDGLKALSAEVAATMEAALVLGLVADATVHLEKKKPIVSQAIPELGVSVSGIFAAGAYVTVEAVAMLDINAKGKAKVGAVLKWPSFRAALDLTNTNSASGSSITGYKPVIEKVFDVDASITTVATLTLPIALNVGIQIIPLNFNKAISLIEEPGITGKVVVAGSVGNAAPASATCNNGAELSAALINDIKLNFFDLKQYTLRHDSFDVFPTFCKKFNSKRYPTLSARQTNVTASTNSSRVSFDDEGANDQIASNPSDQTINKNITTTDNEFTDTADALALAGTAAKEDGFSFRHIVDALGNFVLAPGPDGNLYAGVNSILTVAGQALFGIEYNVSPLDEAERLFHYYPDVMAAYGVSRIRLSKQMQTPTTATAIVLRPANIASNSTASNPLYGVNTGGDAFVTVMCTFANGANSKLFLVQDEQSMASLLLEKLRYTVTGNVVSKCAPVSLAFEAA